MTTLALSRWTLALCLALLALNGCAKDAVDAPTEDAEDGEGPLYAFMSTVYVDEDRLVYIALTESLDADDISFDDARELSGVANFEAIGGRLFISDGETPVITQYSITDELEWVERGSVGFHDFPLTDNANFFYQYMVDEHAMYMPFDGYKRIVWDPLGLEIVEVMDDSELQAERGDLMLEAGGNRTGIRYDGAVLQPFFWHDEDWYFFDDASAIAVYDPKTHEEIKVVEAPCPGLALSSQDEEGNTYFSTWDYSPLFALYDAGPAPCTVRLTPEHELDESFTTDMTQWTDGRFVMNFRYVRDGWGFADVLHDELIDADFSGEVDPTLLDVIWDGTKFKLWRIDLERGEAEPYEDIAASSFGWGIVEAEGRAFMTIPYDDSARTKIYELDEDGHASELFDLMGDVTFMRVR
jgi:hypothetical protein